MAKPKLNDAMMSFELPSELRAQLIAFADKHQMSWSEAIRRFIFNGLAMYEVGILQAQPTKPRRAPNACEEDGL